VSGAAAQPSANLIALPEGGCDLEGVLGEVERRLLLQALDRAGGVRTAAAKSLHLTLRSLRYRMQKHALQAEDDEPVSADSTGPESAP
jgi:two-component system response regulator PilR (NtrC family)